MLFRSKLHEDEYNRIKQEALSKGFTELELAKPDLCALSHKTKSARYFRWIALAFGNGRLRGILHCKETFKDRDDETYTNLYNRTVSWHKLGIYSDSSSLDSDFKDLLGATKSERVLHMINLAYYLGLLYSIRSCDELFYTKICLR